MVYFTRVISLNCIGKGARIVHLHMQYGFGWSVLREDSLTSAYLGISGCSKIEHSTVVRVLRSVDL